ncbi:MAG: RNA polymerase factor sigma-54 [Phycisphaerales bacterium]|nr:RNA polymerase factor sigma-54 [Phycisphaerales bacterium]
MRMGQQMKLAPQMIQSMEILQMSQAELQERIDSELESNATLEIAESAEAELTRSRDDERFVNLAERGPMEVGEQGAAADFERLSTFEESNPEAAANSFDEPERYRESEWEDRRREGSISEDGRDAKMDAMANTADRSKPVSDQLMEQWHLVEIDPRLRELGEVIVGYIEDDGYLRTSLETILDRIPVAGPAAITPRPTKEEMERALGAVQLLLEPAGIGARDSRECLLLQIDARGDDPQGDQSGTGAGDRAWSVARRVVTDHLDDLANNRLPKIAKSLGADIDELKSALGLLRTLSLAPGRRLNEEQEPGIVPDAFVEYDAERDRYIAYLNDQRLPNLRVNQEYAKLVKDRAAPKPTRDFLRTSIGNANFLIDAIEQRKRTVLRVVEAVVDAQREFFDFGPQALKPLPMTKVAEQLGIHVATVSRAVSEKYIQTPRGVVSLRKFFSGGTTSSESGEEMAWDAVKAALREIIDGEDKSNPLSDDELADELKKRGLDIARRTVAKYRGQLNVPTGRLRKIH